MFARERRLRGRFWFLAAAFVVLGCSAEAEPPAADPAEYRAEIEAWRGERDSRLRQPDGWLSLAGLYWLENGDSSFGSDDANDLVFPAGKIEENAGILRRDGREVTLLPSDGSQLSIAGLEVDDAASLALDTSEDGPTLVTAGSLSFYAIERGDMVGIRLKDSESPVLKEFRGMRYFPIDESWRVVGHYDLFAEPRTLRTPNVLGTVTEEQIEGEVRFEFGGKSYTLQPSGDPAEGFFLVFGDQTNGVETYGGGRFLYTEPVAADGTLVIDFNKAYCPPCVFTPFATCPLPPVQNRLQARVEAGEKMFGAAHGGPAEGVN